MKLRFSVPLWLLYWYTDKSIYHQTTSTHFEDEVEAGRAMDRNTAEKINKHRTLHPEKHEISHTVRFEITAIPQGEMYRTKIEETPPNRKLECAQL